MRQMIKLEIRKAFSGIHFWIAFGIAQFFSAASLLSVYQNYLENKNYIEYWKERFPIRQVYTLYHAWMMNNPVSIGSTLFFFWLPVLAAFSFAASYQQEEKRRQLCLVLVRTRREYYFRAKHLAVFFVRISDNFRDTDLESGSGSSDVSKGKAHSILCLLLGRQK